MRKKGTQMIVLVVLFTIISLSLPGSVLAADGQYTISFKAGARGTFTGGATNFQVTKGYGEPLSQAEAVNQLVVKDGYYFSGWSPEIKEVVTEKANYVAQYAKIINEAVYKVNYVDARGGVIATQKVVKTNQSERVTEWALEIEGYRADKESLTKTISKPTGTEMTFVYQSTGDAQERIETETVVRDVEEGGEGQPPAAAPQQEGQTVQTQGENVIAVPDEGVPQQNLELEEGQVESEDEEVPLADKKLKKEASGKTMPWVNIGIITVLLLALLAGGVYLYRKSNKVS